MSGVVFWPNYKAVSFSAAFLCRGLCRLGFFVVGQPKVDKDWIIKGIITQDYVAWLDVAVKYQARVAVCNDAERRRYHSYRVIQRERASSNATLQVGALNALGD